jgi:acetamidase/formamidase
MKNNPFLRASSSIVAGLLAAVAATATEVPYDYHVPLTPENAIIGHFSATKKPVLVVPSGAVVKIDGGGGGGAMRGDNPDPVAWLNDNHIPITPGALTALRETARVQKETPKLPGASGGHLIVGPIYIDGAEPGDTLEIRILDVTPRITFGTTGGAPGRGGLALGSAVPPPAPGTASAGASGKVGGVPRPFGKITVLDVNRNVGIFEPGIEVPLKPFMGVMATCPPDSEGPNRSSRAPGAFGGNLDCSELGAGSTLYLPVFQKGALFYTGDSHAGQGDGEVTGTAIETADTCTLQFILHKGQTIAMPRAETPTDYISFGLDPDLNKAMRQAIAESIDFLKQKRGLDVFKAYALCSIAVNYHVTQVVDATLGVHGMIPKRIFVDEPNTYWYRPAAL